MAQFLDPTFIANPGFNRSDLILGLHLNCSQGNHISQEFMGSGRFPFEAGDYSTLTTLTISHMNTLRIAFLDIFDCGEGQDPEVVLHAGAVQGVRVM